MLPTVPSAELHANVPSMRRDETLDLARGLAVLAMVWVHLVPGPDASEAGILSTVHWASIAWLDGLPAALFLVVMGAAWAIGHRGNSAYILRRALTLSFLGLAFWQWVWPNDILMPIAMMMPLLAIVHSLGRRSMVLAVVVLLLLVPVATALWGDYAWTDVREDGTHAANHELGWCTLRYFLINGAYPLLPWLVFPLLGALLAPLRTNAGALTRVVICAAACVVMALVADLTMGDAYEGGIYAHFDVTWQPTSLPFVALWGGAAAIVLAGLWCCAPAAAWPRLCARIVAVGRVSLSHYLLHTTVLYGALRVWWPAEDWSLGVGLAAAAGYLAFALVATPMLLATGSRGPVEAMLARCSGRRRRGSGR